MQTEREYAKGLARAGGGAIVFALPILMTMEMWNLGATLPPLRFMIFLAANFVVLVGLAHFAGFEAAQRPLDYVLDALAAFGVGMVTSAVLLTVLGLLAPGMLLDEIVGKIAIQAVPASVGAMLATKQFGDQGDDPQQVAKQDRAGLGGQLFLMLAGALFFAFNIAPTEEMIVIADLMTPVHAIALVLLSVMLLHLFVYALGFAGQERTRNHHGLAQTLLLYAVPGYIVALLTSFYVLWTFGRLDGVGPAHALMTVVVLALPASIGASIARLVI